ncbi:MAG: response regulator transcription factor [Chloroflexales bacterium]|nr:response regulator transcription factor [Chloroflexales bacterium]
MAKLRILLVDDHAVVREGLKALISSQPDMEVVGEAVDGLEAIVVAHACMPDVAVIDVSLPGLSGGEVTARITRELPATRVLALSVHDEAGYVRRLLEAGAAGYVLKRLAVDELIAAVRSVAAGGVYLDPLVAGTVVAGAVGKAPVGAEDRPALSEREGDVLRMIAQGYSNKEIAAVLSISVKTVETYKARAMEKLGLDSRVAIVRFAAEQGWLT